MYLVLDSLYINFELHLAYDLWRRDAIGSFRIMTCKPHDRSTHWQIKLSDVRSQNFPCAQTLISFRNITLLEFNIIYIYIFYVHESGPN